LLELLDLNLLSSEVQSIVAFARPAEFNAKVSRWFLTQRIWVRRTTLATDIHYLRHIMTAQISIPGKQTSRIQGVLYTVPCSFIFLSYYFGIQHLSFCWWKRTHTHTHTHTQHSILC